MHRIDSKPLSSLLLLLALVAVCFSGCGPKYPNEKAVYKVQGTVTVDGAPVAGIQISFNPISDEKRPTTAQGTTDAEGKMIISTYAEGDGAPEGEYVVTFSWQEYNMMARSYSGPDKLKKYSDPKTTPFKISVGNGKPNDMGKVELTTKK